MISSDNYRVYCSYNCYNKLVRCIYKPTNITIITAARPCIEANYKNRNTVILVIDHRCGKLHIQFDDLPGCPQLC
jgi:hypothetical protein